MIGKFKSTKSELPQTKPYANHDGITQDLFELTATCQNVIVGEVNWGSNTYRGDNVEVTTWGTTVIITGFKGWVYDMASIPKPFWMIGHPASPRFQRAAKVHDILLKLRLSRSDSDDVFYRVLREDGVGKIRAGLMWSAVRLYGMITNEGRK